MSENTKIDWSYESMPRYIADLHIWLFVTITVAYLFEPIEGYLVVKQIITLWLLTICMSLILRIATFMKRKDEEKKKQEVEERCAAQVELSSEMERNLMKYAYEKDLLLSEVVEEALQAYVKTHQHLLEKNDADT
ncbi:hypothetical protein JHD46_05255 [Sulfurimonas sp. SAG-AH-194-C20]|nr:hypothetical protein [Sulfurimonas sp. SAG-AH-194-C20]MDF1879046.1 hypothetical protein [Sulfurimonas sp. SAG-AH-194-C20]